MSDPQQGATIETDVPARLDRLPWSRWHSRIIVALGTSWLLDGLEVTMVGSLSGILESQAGLHLTDPRVTGAATTYLAGAVAGALLFGYLTDRLGRRKLFLVTLTTYSIAAVASAFHAASAASLFSAFSPGWGSAANVWPSTRQLMNSSPAKCGEVQLVEVRISNPVVRAFHTAPDLDSVRISLHQQIGCSWFLHFIRPLRPAPVSSFQTRRARGWRMRRFLRHHHHRPETARGCSAGF